MEEIKVKLNPFPKRFDDKFIKNLIKVKKLPSYILNTKQFILNNSIHEVKISKTKTLNIIDQLYYFLKVFNNPATANNGYPYIYVINSYPVINHSNLLAFNIYLASLVVNLNPMWIPLTRFNLVKNPSDFAETHLPNVAFLTNVFPDWDNNRIALFRDFIEYFSNIPIIITGCSKEGFTRYISNLKINIDFFTDIRKTISLKSFKFSKD